MTKSQNKKTSQSAPLRLVSLEAERALLANLIYDVQDAVYVEDFLKPEHFGDQRHAKIYGVILQYFEEGLSLDPYVLKPRLQGELTFENTDINMYIDDILCSYVSAQSTKSYGLQIYDFFVRRSVYRIGEDTLNEISVWEADKALNPERHIERMEERLFSLVAAQRGTQAVSFKHIIDQVVHEAQQAKSSPHSVVGISSGFLDLDHKLGGFHPSDLIVVAGRPGMGKTAFATNMAFDMAQKFMKNGTKSEGCAVAFFSLEMSSAQLGLRMLSQYTSIPSHKIRTGRIQDDVLEAAVHASKELESLPMYIDDTPALSIAALRTRARRLVRQHNIGLLMVDYIQLLTGGRMYGDSRVQEISEITRGLKAIAKELSIPVIALSQLSRAVEQREDKRPMLSDLRESGTIEQDADVVCFVYRHSYYAKDLPQEEKHLAEVIISKQRHGPTGTVKLGFQGEFTRFFNLTHEHDPWDA